MWMRQPKAQTHHQYEPMRPVLLLLRSPDRRPRGVAVPIDCGEPTQVERVSRRPGWNEAMARAVVAQQATRAARRAIADAVIFNDGISLDELQEAVKHIYGHWTDRRPRL